MQPEQGMHLTMRVMHSSVPSPCCWCCTARRLIDIITSVNSSHVYLVLEYLDCDLRRYLQPLNMAPSHACVKVSAAAQACLAQGLVYIMSSCAVFTGATDSSAVPMLCCLRAQNIMRQILRGIEHVHSHLVLHRDLKVTVHGWCSFAVCHFSSKH